MDYPAGNIVIWNGEEIPCCTRHAISFVSIGQAMGVNVPVYTVKPGLTKECKNCKTEAERNK